MNNAIKALLLLFAAPSGAAELMLKWDMADKDWADGYRVYCHAQAGETNDPISVTETEIPLADFGFEDGTSVYCYVRAFRGDMETLPSEVLTFTYAHPREIVLPAAPGSITITWE
jgi:hypothetical protein